MTRVEFLSKSLFVSPWVCSWCSIWIMSSLHKWSRLEINLGFFWKKINQFFCTSKGVHWWGEICRNKRRLLTKWPDSNPVWSSEHKTPMTGSLSSPWFVQLTSRVTSLLQNVSLTDTASDLFRQACHKSHWPTLKYLSLIFPKNFVRTCRQVPWRWCCVCGYRGPSRVSFPKLLVINTSNTNSEKLLSHVHTSSCNNCWNECGCFVCLLFCQWGTCFLDVHVPV